ncbi:DUF2332 family protein [Streptomyces sioyaensis]|uniref:DUF2332 family protein n=1 Tax=Streptomyces sioyaensis TaxID=67364 RepID=UPI001F2C889C|nr:DUF2332 family protein [Streptomyces sioyaensis]MCF3172904.1 DUF2332 family protein [Streptomyces sioyaensis]
MVVNTGNVEGAAGGAWAVAERYREFSWREARGRSKAHEELSARIGQDQEFCELLSGSLPAGEKQQPALLLAAVRHLDGPHADLGPRGAAAYTRWREWTVRHWDEVRAVVMRRTPQADEPARCAGLLPLLAGLPQPLALLEAGSSAGLGLHPDRYRYRYARTPYADEAEETEEGPGRADGADPRAEIEAGAPGSPAVFGCRTDWAAEELAGPLPRIVWRAGIAPDPLDPVAEPDDLRWLQACVWPGDGERAARLSAAVAAVRAAPRPRIVRGDPLGELPALAAEAPPEATLVIFHSAALGGLPPARREEFARLVRSLLDARPGGGHWISHEPHSVLPWLTPPAHRSPHPDPQDTRLTLALDGRPVALTGPYGQSLHRLPGAAPAPGS